MKIKCFVTVVAPRAADGVAIEVKPGGVADIQTDKAEYLIAEGYAEKAKRKDAESGVQPAGVAKKGRSTATQAVRGGSTQSTRGGQRRARAELLGDSTANDPDREKGENGKGFDENDEADSNAE